MRTLFALIFALLSVRSAQAGVVVWLQDDVPDARSIERADAKTGGTQHAFGHDVAFPPMPSTDEDDARIERLREVIADGQRRWNDFEVEYDIALALEEALGAIDVLRDERDRAEVVAALLFQGAAIRMALEPEELRDGDRGRDFRIVRTGTAAVRPWADAVALRPDRDPLPSDVADGSTFPQLRAEVGAARGVAPGELRLAPLAEGDVYVVDGLPRPDAGDTLELLPGRHFVHVLREGRIAARRVLQIASEQPTTFAPFASGDELAAARERVLSGTTVGFSDAVRASIERIAAERGGQVFVAAEQDGKLEVLPYAHGAELLQQRPVTFVGVGEVGGAVLSSEVFAGADGSPVFAPGISGSLGFELGIYNAVVLGGVDLNLTPGEVVKFADGTGEANVSTSAFPQPYAGLGAYLLRPTGRQATVLIAGHYTWLFPSHHGVGGRFSLGIPMDDSGATWVRLTAGGTYGGSTTWGTDEQMLSAFLRGGLAARF